MKSYKTSLFIHLISATTLVLMSGCAEVDPNVRDQVPVAYPVPATQSELDELLEFGVKMSNTPASSRVETCKSLLKRQKEASDDEITFKLMVGRSLSDSCGDIPKILDSLNQIPPENFSDEQMQRFVVIHTEILKRINATSKKLGSLEHKQKTVQNVPDGKEANGSKAGESRLLREKLEAIRSMEKQLDESSDGK